LKLPEVSWRPMIIHETTDLRFFTKRALYRNVMLAGVVWTGRMHAPGTARDSPNRGSNSGSNSDGQGGLTD